MEHRDRERRREMRVGVKWAAAGLGAFFLVVLLTFLAGAETLAQDENPPGEPPAAVEDDADRGNIESNDDAVSDGDDAGDALAKDAPIEQWQYLSAAVLPWIIAVVNRQRWTTEQRTLGMFVVAGAVAIGGAWFRGELDNFAFTSTAVLQLSVLTWGSYQVISRLPVLAPAIRGLENMTTPKADRVPPA